MKSGIRRYSATYISGIILSTIYTIPTLISLIITPTLILLSYITRTNRVLFLLITHTLCIIIGNSSVNIELKDSLPDKVLTGYLNTTSQIKESIINNLATHIKSPQELSTIAAIALGEKNLMDKSLKEAYSKGGAMHILALSGLHVGIIFFIVTTTLSILTILPKGKLISKVASVTIIFTYAALTGCSPSVLRASLMIFTYKIAELSFRDVEKWDCIAISALLICIISPSDLFSIGFQLSFAAVAGITLLYPTCRAAWSIGERYIFAPQSVIKRGVKRVWDTLCISICCQITTLPFVLFYFGTSPNYYLISNIIAIPLATSILYLLPIAMLLSKVPLLGDSVYQLLEYLTLLMNNCIKEISI